MNYLCTTISFVVWATLSFAAEPGATPAPDLWRLVAKSHTIISGQLGVPLDQINEATAAGEGRYVEISVGEPHIIKGPTPEGEVVVRYWTEPPAYAPSTALLEELHGKEAILFLIQFDEAGPDNYFTRAPNALHAFSAEGLAAVVVKVKAQEAILRAYQPAVTEDADFRRVKKLVDSLTKPRKAEAALAELQSLGKESVPAMIHLMDDRRELAIKQITVPTPPGHWEGFAHYAPQNVVDVMTILVGRITGESFSTIYNGGSERERAAAVDAWRIYLHHLTAEPEVLPEGPAR